MNGNDEKKCSHVFDWIMVFLVIAVGVAGIVVWIILDRGGKVHNCLGKKGAWTKTQKTLVENIMIQNSKKAKKKMTQSCLDCVVEEGEKKYDPVQFITQMGDDEESIEKLIENCCN